MTKTGSHRMCKFSMVLIAALLATNGVHPVQAQQPPMAAAAPFGVLPPPWSMMGNGGPLALPGRCEIGLDNAKAGVGSQVYAIRCTNTVLPSFAGARTNFDVAPYRG